MNEFSWLMSSLKMFSIYFLFLILLMWLTCTSFKVSNSFNVPTFSYFCLFF